LISGPDRYIAVQLIVEAHLSGARYSKACQVLKISTRTFQRWRKDGESTIDRRKGAIKSKPSFALTNDEVQEILDICHSVEFSSLPPNQIVPILADRGKYIASESSFYRVLAKHNENIRRGRSKRPVKRQAPQLIAVAPNDIWATDITWLPGPVVGLFYYLYAVIDIYSRKIVGFEVYEVESSENLTSVVRKAISKLNGVKPNIFHSDNGSPMKGQTLMEFLYSLNISKTFSRPRVKNDNAHIESFFKTLKYFPAFPYQGLNDITEARVWVTDFINTYNNYHLHSSINYVTPSQKYDGKDIEILEHRNSVYQNAMQNNPLRWSMKKTRDFTPAGSTTVGTKSNLKGGKKKVA
jgi:putative transposase